MTDLRDRIHTYAQTLGDVAPVTAEEAIARTAPRPVRRPGVVALAAGLAVVAAIGAVVVLDLFPSGPGEEVVATTTTAAPATTTTMPPTSTEATTTTVATTTTPPPRPAAYRWEPVDDPAIAELAPDSSGAVYSTVEVDGTRLTVGEVDGNAVAWIRGEDDGWSVVEIPNGSGKAANDAIVVEDEVVVVGWSHEEGVPWVSVTRDGSVWEEVTVEDGVGEFRAAALHLGTIVAAGTDIWTSPDGRSWTMVVDLPDSTQAFDVASDGSTVVVVGQSAGRISDPVVLWSEDAVTWTSVPASTLSIDDENLFMYSVTATPAGFVAGGGGSADLGISSAGGLAASDAHLWSSSDGRVWAQVAWDPRNLGGGRGQWINGIANGDGVLVAVGEEIGADWSHATGVVWESDDQGATWNRIPDPDRIFGSFYGGFSGLLDVSVAPDGRLLAVGTLLERPAVWIGESVP